MNSRIKIFFVLPTLFAGGAERVISFVSQNLDKEKFDITLIIIGFEKDSKYEIEEIKVSYLNKSRVLSGIFPLMYLLIRHRPKIVLGSISHLNAALGIIAVFFRKIVFIGRHAAVSGILRRLEGYESNKNKIKIFNYHNFGIKNLDYHICQSQDMKQNLMDSYGIQDKFLKIINNPITENNIKKENNFTYKTKKYITVGRLSIGKGYIRILQLLSKLTFPFVYTIIGEGPYYKNIMDEIERLSLGDKVKYINFTDKVSEYLVKHDIFLQGSYTEGFPNALLESCAVGTPVIAFRAPGGTQEIVENEVNGFLVENESEFLERLNDHRRWNPEKIRESVFKKFNKEKIINDYQDFFLEVLK